jgi:hypothetical protein
MNNVIYINNKNGKQYCLLHMATDRTNAREGGRMVVYSPVDDSSEIAVRDEAEFYDKFSPLNLAERCSD